MATDCLYPFHGYRRRVYVCADVAGVWCSHRQTKAATGEAFGVLVGSTSEDRKQIWIEALTTPKRHDLSWRVGFQLRDPGHQEFVNQMFKRSGGSMIYLGTWHTHSESKPAPSNTDKHDWRACLRRNMDRPLVFVIVGTEEVRLYVRWGQRFRCLRAGALGR